MRSNSLVLQLLGATAAAGALACSDANGGGGAGIGLAFSTRAAPGGIAASVVGTGSGARPSVIQAADSTVVVLGNDSVIIRSVELVMREIELERVDAADCDLAPEDACEEFTVGVQVVPLPLGSSTEKRITVNVPAGVYDEVEFDIHKPESSNDAAFIAANPAFDGVSIRVTGTFSRAGSRSDFVYTTDLDKEQEHAIVPPLDVTADGAANVTLRLDIATWFVSETGLSLVDPASANKGGQNEGVVKNNIEQSIEAFHDDDSDGLDDVGEDDDGGRSPDSP